MTDQPTTQERCPTCDSRLHTHRGIRALTNHGWQFCDDLWHEPDVPSFDEDWNEYHSRDLEEANQTAGEGDVPPPTAQRTGESVTSEASSEAFRMARAGIEAARDRRTVESFNDEIGDAIERDALAALDAIRTRLEEHELYRAWMGEDRPFMARNADLAAQVQVLQDELAKALLAVSFLEDDVHAAKGSSMRRLLHLDWLCHGCHRQGSLRWLGRHECPERDRYEAEMRARFEGRPAYSGSRVHLR